tara:strand:+ start:1581 stop:2465 length:885 start_codon:yes stop_codon:yes gene_type:complete
MNHILRILIGLTFIVSGVAKLYPIEPFEIVFIDLGIANFYTAPFLARLLIVFEIFLGLSIIFNLWLKNIIYYLTQTTLVIFTIYLAFLLFTQGNDVDCGCFGSLIALTPIQSIIKNVLLIIGLLFVKRRYHSSGLLWVSILFIIISSVATFSLNRVGLHNLQGVEVNEEVDFSGLPELYKTNEKVAFSKGKKMVAFFTWTCPHCINASRKFVALNKQKEIKNLYVVIGSKKEAGLLEFFDKTKCDFPTIWMKDDEFYKYSGGRLPAIVYIEDGVIKKKWFGDLFDVDEMRTYLE